MRNQKNRALKWEGVLVFLLSVFLFSPLGGQAEESEDPPRWTESLRSPDGIYALSVDLKNKRVFVFRADNRTLGTDQLRVRILHEGSASRDLVLRKAVNAEAPWRYSGVFKDWDGTVDTVELAIGIGGNKWKTLGRFSKPRERVGAALVTH